MRKQFVEGTSRYLAKKECPWSIKIVKVYGGFKCFEDITDYEVWKNQK